MYFPEYHEYLCYTDGLFEDDAQYAFVVEPGTLEQLSRVIRNDGDNYGQNLWLPIKWIKFRHRISDKAGPIKVRILPHGSGASNEREQCTLCGSWEGYPRKGVHYSIRPVDEKSAAWKTANAEWNKIQSFIREFGR